MLSSTTIKKVAKKYAAFISSTELNPEQEEYLAVLCSVEKDERLKRVLESIDRVFHTLGNEKEEIQYSELLSFVDNNIQFKGLEVHINIEDSLDV